MDHKKVLLIISLMILLSIGMGCIGSDDDKGKETMTKGFKDITVEESKILIDKGEVFLLDVRTKEEFNSVHIEGAILIPLDELGSRLDEVPEDKKLLIYCRSGRRSVTASNILVDAGYTEVYNMLGGINQWQNAGYPVVLEGDNTSD